MPAAAVVGGAIGASTLFGAAAGALTAMEVIGAVGAITAGIGVVTGDKTLSTIGGALGLVGGIGKFAGGTELLGGADTITIPDSINPGVTSPAAEALAAPAVEAAPASILDGNTSSYMSAEEVGKVLSPVAETQPGLLNTVGSPPPVSAAPALKDVFKGQGSIFDVLKDFVEPAAKFSKENQAFTYGAMQVGGNFLSGLFAPDIEAKKRALASQASVNEAQANLYQQRANTVAQPLPKATAIATGPVAPILNSTPTSYTPPGILTNITGRPA